MPGALLRRPRGLIPAPHRIVALADRIISLPLGISPLARSIFETLRCFGSGPGVAFGSLHSGIALAQQLADLNELRAKFPFVCPKLLDLKQRVVQLRRHLVTLLLSGASLGASVARRLLQLLDQGADLLCRVNLVR
jgi:hypothetical protein